MKHQLTKAFSLVEMMVSTALISMIFAALTTSAVFVQRSVNAGQLYAERQAQQLQVSDYLARDVRNARDIITVGNTVTIKVPDCYESDGSLREPQLDGKGGVSYGTVMKTIVYTFSGGTIQRTSDLAFDMPFLVLAEGLDDFDVKFVTADRTMEMQMTFTPRFSYSDSPSSTIRDGTLAVSRTMRRNEKPEL